MTGQEIFWGQNENSVREWTEKCSRSSLIRRLWEKDASLWKKDAQSQAEIRSRLGWLTAASSMKNALPELKSFSEEIKREGFTQMLLLGMGGSSLAPELFQSVFGNAAGYPKLLVLDSTDPARVKDVENQIDLEKTLFIVSSKSGGTIELLSFFKYFFEKLRQTKKGKAAERFVAITDAGTPLHSLAREEGFRKIFLSPEDVGGRFSALTYFGLVPASLIGADVSKILESAERMMKDCSGEISAAENAAAALGVGMAVLAEAGRDKLTILTSDGFEAFGDWAEQLVAESTCKEDAGIIPVVREPAGKAEVYGADRFFAALLLESKDNAALEAHLDALQKAGHPVLRIFLKDADELGGEFFRWEMATAIACSLLKVNAFDQPDVQAAKDGSKAILKNLEAGTQIPVRQSEMSPETFWENAETGDYAAILAFLPDTPAFRQRLFKLAETIRNRTHLAATLGFGPRYLHSTGQLHKGGPNTGVFLLFTAEHAEDLKIPGQKYTFGQLELAQAMGDFEALERKARWLLHKRLPELSEKALEEACTQIENAIQPGASVSK